MQRLEQIPHGKTPTTGIPASDPLKAAVDQKLRAPYPGTTEERWLLFLITANHIQAAISACKAWCVRFSVEIGLCVLAICWLGWLCWSLGPTSASRDGISFLSSSHVENATQGAQYLRMKVDDILVAMKNTQWNKSQFDTITQQIIVALDNWRQRCCDYAIAHEYLESDMLNQCIPVINSAHAEGNQCTARAVISTSLNKLNGTANKALLASALAMDGKTQVLKALYAYEKFFEGSSEDIKNKLVYINMRTVNADEAQALQNIRNVEKEALAQVKSGISRTVVSDFFATHHENLQKFINTPEQASNRLRTSRVMAEQTTELAPDLGLEIVDAFAALISDDARHADFYARHRV
jgi:hypothetical protein